MFNCIFREYEWIKCFLNICVFVIERDVFTLNPILIWILYKNKIYIYLPVRCEFTALNLCRTAVILLLKVRAFIMLLFVSVNMNANQLHILQCPISERNLYQTFMLQKQNERNATVISIYCLLHVCSKVNKCDPV